MTIDEASKHYAKMLFPAGEGLYYESARTDFKAGAEWQQTQDKPMVKTLESIKSAANAALLLIESQQS